MCAPCVPRSAKKNVLVRFFRSISLPRWMLINLILFYDISFALLLLLWVWCGHRMIHSVKIIKNELHRNRWAHRYWFFRVLSNLSVFFFFVDSSSCFFFFVVIHSYSFRMAYKRFRSAKVFTIMLLFLSALFFRKSLKFCHIDLLKPWLTLCLCYDRLEYMLLLLLKSHKKKNARTYTLHGRCRRCTHQSTNANYNL